MADTVQKIIKTTFQFKRGQSTDWNSINPILATGEPGLELDTGKLKIGDGVKNWNGLPYFLHENTVLIPGLNGAEDFTQKDFIAGIMTATDGTVPIKSNGALTWIKPVQETDLVTIINQSAEIKNAIATKIQEELADTTVLRFKGEAVSADEPVNGIIPALYDNNMNEIIGQDGDVYLYQGTEYVYDETQNGWVELGTSERFNSLENLVTQNEILPLQEIISNIRSDVDTIKNTPATNTLLGLVKGSTGQDKIFVNADGTMSVNTIGIDKLVNVQGIELILDGGNANNLEINS